MVFMLSGVISCEKIKNFNWKNIFNATGISDSFKSDDTNFDMDVHFLNVGKADCIYIKFRDHNILIDAADKDPSSVVKEYLKKQGVSKFDLVAVSHPHRDHIGQMEDVIKEFEIKKFIEPDLPENLIPTGNTYKRMLKAIYSKKVDSELILGAKEIKIDNLKINILGPIEKNEKNINNDSIVMKITYSDVSFIFMGDAQKEEEESILKSGKDVKADVIKIGHHGSKTSSSESFLKKVSPKYAIISVGPDRSNLPKEEILTRIKKLCPGVSIHRTDLEGNIIVSTNGKDIKVKSEKK